MTPTKEVSTALPDLRAIRLDELAALTPACSRRGSPACSSRNPGDPSARRSFRLVHLASRPGMSRPLVPLSQIVLKVHSRCDLACDHCYVYEAADQSWHGRPMVISDEVTAQAARRIADHAAAHALPAVQIILHGGEPLLAGPARLRRIITALRSATGRRLRPRPEDPHERGPAQ